MSNTSISLRAVRIAFTNHLSDFYSDENTFDRFISWTNKYDFSSDIWLVSVVFTACNRSMKTVVDNTFLF